jgi:glutaredoxin 3
MTTQRKRKIEIFSAGCPVCEETITLVKELACESCEITIVDMNEPGVAEKAKRYGVATVPSVAIDGKLADCCTGREVNEASLRAAGLGVPLS